MTNESTVRPTVATAAMMTSDARDVDDEAPERRGLDERHADDERQQHEKQVEAALVEDAADRRACLLDRHAGPGSECCPRIARRTRAADALG